MNIKVEIELVEMDENNFHVLVDSTLNDGSNGKWVIDTGASKTVFDKNLEDNYTLLPDTSEELHSAGGTDSPVVTNQAVLKKVSFAKLKISDMKVALLDLQHINELYSATTNHKICGLLGSDFFNKYGAVINFKTKTLQLHHK